MERAEIVKIVEEERMKNGDSDDALMSTQVRLSVEIASRVIKPVVSKEQWELFLRFVKIEPYLHRIFIFSDGPVVSIELNQFFEIYETIEKAYLLILDERDHVPDALKQGEQREKIVQGACAISVRRDMMRETIIEECGGDGTFTFSIEEAKETVDRMRWIQTAFAGKVLVDTFVREADETSDIMWGYLRN